MMSAVNKDVFRYEKARYFITMDNRFIIWEVENQRRTLPKKPTKIFIANMASIARLRQIVCRYKMESANLSHYDMIIKSYKHDGGLATASTILEAVETLGSAPSVCFDYGLQKYSFGWS